MKFSVLGTTKYILTNSWIGLLLPAGVHQLLNIAEKSPPTTEKQPNPYRAHPAESRMSRYHASTGVISI